MKKGQQTPSPEDKLREAANYFYNNNATREQSEDFIRICNLKEVHDYVINNNKNLVHLKQRLTEHVNDFTGGNEAHTEIFVNRLLDEFAKEYHEAQKPVVDTEALKKSFYDKIDETGGDEDALWLLIEPHLQPAQSDAVEFVDSFEFRRWLRENLSLNMTIADQYTEFKNEQEEKPKKST